MIDLDQPDPVDPRVAKLSLVEMTQEEFDELGEYSMSIPTGTTPGTRWKKNLNVIDPLRNRLPPVWIMGSYFDLGPESDKVGIRWNAIQIVEPQPEPEPPPPSALKLLMHLWGQAAYVDQVLKKIHKEITPDPDDEDPPTTIEIKNLPDLIRRAPGSRHGNPYNQVVWAGLEMAILRLERDAILRLERDAQER